MTTTETLLYHLRASGPATLLELANYLLDQHPSVTPANYREVGQLSLDTALKSGWVEVYDTDLAPGELPAYDITAAGLANWDAVGLRPAN